MINIETLLYKIAIDKTNPSDIKYLSKIPSKELEELVKLNKLRDPIMKQYKKLVIDDNYWDKKKKQNHQQEKELAKILNIFNQQKIEYLGIKGISMRKYYPDNIPRQSSDFDILIKDINYFWECAKILKNEGYTYGSIPVFTYEGGILGVAEFHKDLGSETQIRIELNIGGFGMTKLTWVLEEEIWENKEKLNFEQVEIPVPNKEFDLILLVAELTGNHHYRIRDFIDYKYLMESDTHLDQSHVFRKLKKLLLHKYFNRIEKQWKKLLLSKFKNSKNIFTKMITFEFHREIYHIIPYAFKYKGFSAFNTLYFHYLRQLGEFFVSRDLLLPLIKKIEILLPLKRRFYSGVDIQLIPLTEKFTGPWKLEQYDKFHLVRSPIGVFLASNFCLHEDEELVEAMEVAIKEFSSY